jgi:hypothetical protein
MKKPEIYEKYPLWIIAVIDVLNLLVYIAGAYIMFKLSLITGWLYVIFLVFIEASVYREGCANCCYYGKACAFGRGFIAPLFVKKGSPKKFCEKKIEWKDLIPQMLVVLIPVITGIALLISRGFNLRILIALIYPVLSWFMLNPIIYGKLACPHCKQGSICCPAVEFFSKKKK